MPEESVMIAAEINREVGTLISRLATAGWMVAGCRYDVKIFGDWYIDLRRADIEIRLVKDRSQYMVHKLRIEEAKTAGLWKAFDNLEEFKNAVLRWAIA
jgi:hypothetical protein